MSIEGGSRGTHDDPQTPKSALQITSVMSPRLQEFHVDLGNPKPQTLNPIPPNPKHLRPGVEFLGLMVFPL